MIDTRLNALPDPTVRSLIRAAMSLDVDQVTDKVLQAITDRGVSWAWDRLIHPVWDALGGGNDSADAPIVAERLFSRAMSEVLTAATRPSTRTSARVLLAAADEEARTLPLDALAAVLMESGVGTCVLGARVPPQAVAAAAGRLRPAVVVVWSQIPDTADPRQIASALSARPGSAVIAAGPGWSPATLPARAIPATGVVAASRTTSALLDGRARPRNFVAN